MLKNGAVKHNNPIIVAETKKKHPITLKNIVASFS